MKHPCMVIAPVTTYLLIQPYFSELFLQEYLVAPDKAFIFVDKFIVEVQICPKYI